MRQVALITLLDVAELVSLGAFLTMIGLAARAFGA
jgi:membrane protein implicated in regulation of membrane protease activity